MLTRSFLAIVVLFGAACSACGGERTAPPRTPVVVVPIAEEEPDQWLARDEPEESSPSAPNVTYVKLHEWTPAPQVAALEARIPPRGNEAPSFTSFPKLTLDREIGQTRWGRRR